MHQYTIDTDIRRDVYVGLLVPAGAIATALNLLIAKLAAAHPIVQYTVTPGVVYGILFWIFNNYAWAWPGVRNWVKIPNLNGSWTCNGQQYDHNQEPTQAWNASIKIVQTFTKISIGLQTGQSMSESSLAGIASNATFGDTLSYEYRNTVLPGNKEMADHPGFCRLYLKTEGEKQSLEGLYFNGPSRWTHGKMTLEKKEK